MESRNAVAKSLAKCFQSKLDTANQKLKESQANQLGIDVANILIADGAGAILSAIYHAE